MKKELFTLKPSKYNHQIEKNGQLFLYNTLTGGCAQISKEYIPIFQEAKLNNSISKFLDLPTNIIDKLLQGGFLIPQNMDEFQVIKSLHQRMRFGNKNSLALTLLPTLNCNFRCPYCYEKDKEYPNPHMTEEVMDAYRSCKRHTHLYAGVTCRTNGITSE